MEYEKRYIPMYKCRICGAKFIKGDTIKIEDIDNVASYACSVQPVPEAPPMYQHHNCEGGKPRCGIGDLVGFDTTMVPKED